MTIPQAPLDPLNAARARIHAAQRSDAGQDITMIHTDIRDGSKPVSDYKQPITDALRVTDDLSKAVQKTPHRVTLDSMLQRIVHEEFIHPTALPSMTICVLKLDNGFVLIGKSTPADPDNYDVELGKKFSKEDAIRQMWSFEAYLLRERLAILDGTVSAET